MVARRNRGRRKTDLRELSRQWPSDEERQAVFDSIVKGDGAPIVIAILGTALVECELERLLRSRFYRKDDTTWARLIGEYGPLNTFAAKIIAGHAFGLYDDVLKTALNSIKAIRNAFAHSKKLIDFNDEPVVAEFRSLELPSAKRSQLYRDLTYVKQHSNGKVAYIVLCLIVVNKLVDRQIRSLKSRNRRLTKRTRITGQSPYRNALVAALMSPPPEQQGYFGGLFGLSQTGDPTPPANQLTRLSSLLQEATPHGKKGK